MIVDRADKYMFLNIAHGVFELEKQTKVDILNVTMPVVKVCITLLLKTI